MTWRTLSRSVIGTRHERLLLPCQDASGDRQLGDLLLGAIADGAGSVPHSDVGATLAVQTALDYLENLDGWLQPSDHPTWPTLQKPPSFAQARRLFERTVTKVRLALQQCAEHHYYNFEDLACTLILFAATPHWLVAMQIGDGFIVTRSREATFQLLFRPDKGEFINQTTFVTSAPAIAEMQVGVIAEPPQFICAASDAFERLALRFSDWTPHPPFFKPLEEYLLETPVPAEDDTYIINFLKSEYLNHHTDDDKTLLLSLQTMERGIGTVPIRRMSAAEN
ncbi:MAG: PP2C family serine/threonine-protein phosphatase [Thermosynechococcaceae cyanobacterium]